MGLQDVGAEAALGLVHRVAISLDLAILVVDEIELLEVFELDLCRGIEVDVEGQRHCDGVCLARIRLGLADKARENLRRPHIEGPGVSLLRFVDFVLAKAGRMMCEIALAQLISLHIDDQVRRIDYGIRCRILVFVLFEVSRSREDNLVGRHLDGGQGRERLAWVRHRKRENVPSPSGVRITRMLHPEPQLRFGRRGGATVGCLFRHDITMTLSAISLSTTRWRNRTEQEFLRTVDILVGISHIRDFRNVEILARPGIEEAERKPFEEYEHAVGRCCSIGK